MLAIRTLGLELIVDVRNNRPARFLGERHLGQIANYLDLVGLPTYVIRGAYFDGNISATSVIRQPGGGERAVAKLMNNVVSAVEGVPDHDWMITTGAISPRPLYVVAQIAVHNIVCVLEWRHGGVEPHGAGLGLI